MSPSTPASGEVASVRAVPSQVDDSRVFGVSRHRVGCVTDQVGDDVAGDAPSKGLRAPFAASPAPLGPAPAVDADRDLLDVE
jgi:hypothetical protein